MNKDAPKNDELNTKPPAVVGRVFRKNQKSTKQIVIILVCILLIPIIIVLIVHGFQEKKKRESQIDYAKVGSLVKSVDCSASAQQSVSKEQPSTQQVAASTVLLNYRSLCLEKSGKYKEANQVLEQLKSYYSLNNETQYIPQVDDQINANNKVIK